MSRAYLMIAALGAVSACLMAGTPCPCGQSFDRDPFGSGEGFYVGPEHDASAHCYCRCGDGPRERLAPSETCEAYEGSCISRSGQTERYVCE
jgi:hypothetical protein